MVRDKRAIFVRSRKRLRFSFSGEHLELTSIGRYHRDIEVAVRLYFSLENARLNTRFSGYTPEEVEVEMDEVLEENERNSAMNILAALEAAFRIDFIQRGQARKRDGLSRILRPLYMEKGARVSLEDDILRGWKQVYPDLRSTVSDLIGAFRYRHWLAHGRYWTPRLGRRYDYQEIYALADSIFDVFPFEGVGSK